MKTYFVYMLRCNDDSYYTGITDSVERRINEHTTGIDSACYTFKRRPVKLVYVSEFREVTEAIAWEKRLKGWSRKKKEALIRGDVTTLKQLSKRRGGKIVSP